MSYRIKLHTETILILPLYGVVLRRINILTSISFMLTFLSSKYKFSSLEWKNSATLVKHLIKQMCNFRWVFFSSL